MIIFAVMLLFALLSLVLGGHGRHDPVRDHSSLRANAWGTKALAELCRENGLPAPVWDRPLDGLTHQQRLLCLFDPTLTPDEDQLAGLLAWVHGGGWLLAAVDLDETHNFSLAARSTVGPDEVLLASLGLVGDARGHAEAMVRPSAYEPELREVRGVIVPGPHRLRAGTPADFTVLHQTVPKDKRADLRLRPQVPLNWQTLLGDDAGAVLLRASHGKGRLYVLSETELLANKHLARADNVVLATNLIYASRAPRVYFEEGHHVVRVGLSEEAQQLDPSRALSALFAAMAALALYLVGRGWRFGAPVPLISPPRRSALEFVNAVADLHRRAGARQAVLEALRLSFRRHLATAAGVPPEWPADALAAAVATRRQVSEVQLAALLRQLEPTGGDAPDDRELLTLTRLVASYEEAVRHGRRHH